jgi:quercetin dioxygenase-like cupin family protein
MNKEQASNNRLMSPCSINDFINYQEDAVVSRELIHKATGTVTLFAFDKNQGLSEHTAPYDALVMITDGQAEITVSGVKHEIKTGEMLLMPANSPHALKALEPFKMVLTMIKS